MGAELGAANTNSIVEYPLDPYEKEIFNDLQNCKVNDFGTTKNNFPSMRLADWDMIATFTEGIVVPLKFILLVSGFCKAPNDPSPTTWNDKVRSTSPTSQRAAVIALIVQ